MGSPGLCCRFAGGGGEVGLVGLFGGVPSTVGTAFGVPSAGLVGLFGDAPTTVGTAFGVPGAEDGLGMGQGAGVSKPGALGAAVTIPMLASVMPS